MKVSNRRTSAICAHYLSHLPEFTIALETQLTPAHLLRLVVHGIPAPSDEVASTIPHNDVDGASEDASLTLSPQAGCVQLVSKVTPPLLS